jgi:tetrahydromethanopterin S-methyltransferase subunit G
MKDREKKGVKIEKQANRGCILQIIGWMIIGIAALVLFIDFEFSKIIPAIIIALVGGLLLLIGNIMEGVSDVRGLTNETGKIVDAHKKDNADIEEIKNQIEEAQKSNDEEQIQNLENKIAEKQKSKTGRIIGWIIATILGIGLAYLLINLVD